MRALAHALRIRGASRLWLALTRRSFKPLGPGTKFASSFSTTNRWCHSQNENTLSTTPHDPRPDAVRDLEQKTLDRARTYNITTLDQLWFESDVHKPQRLDSRRLDGPTSYRDLELWCICLDFQRLRFGDQGVKNIFQGLRARCGSHFPLVGPYADYLWDAFVSTATRDFSFLHKLCLFELQTGAQRDTFSIDVVGSLLESENPSWARSVIRLLLRKHRFYAADVFHFFSCACRSELADALKAFRLIYAILPRSNIYGHAIGHLLEQGRIVDAFVMHKYLVSIGDLPQDFASLAPLIQAIAQTGSDLNAFLHELARSGASFDAQARRLHEQERTRIAAVSTDTPTNIKNATSGKQPRTVTDQFAARGFATAPLSFELVLGGLQMLGLVSVGPLSIRQIALASNGPEILRKRFTQLHLAGVDTGASAYVRIVKRLANQDQSALLTAVLETDQHVEVFDDAVLQKQLLQKYYQAQDWPQINRTLAILNLGQIDKLAEVRSANFLLQAMLGVADWAGAAQMVDKMRRDSQQIYRESAMVMVQSLRPTPKPFSLRHWVRQTDEIGVVVRLWHNVLESGRDIKPKYWREILVKLGVVSRWEDLERTTLWIASWYSNSQVKGIDEVGHASRLAELDDLFNSRLQRRMIAFAFLAAGHANEQRPNELMTSYEKSASKLPWVRVIKLFRSLQMKGVKIDHAGVQLALTFRLRTLFSDGGFSRVPRNRRFRNWNPYSLVHFLKTFYQAWMKPLRHAEEYHLTKEILTTKPLRRQQADYLRTQRFLDRRYRRKLSVARRWRERRARFHEGPQLFQATKQGQERVQGKQEVRSESSTNMAS